MRPLLRLALLPLALLLPGAASQTADETLWFSITAGDGTPIGHSSQRVTRSPTGSEAVNTQEILLQEEGTPVARVQDITTVRLNPEGSRPLTLARQPDGAWRFDRQSVPPHVEYQLSTLGQSLSETLITLDNWAERNHQNLKAARERFDASFN